jgi:hypothetical protein
MKPLSAFEAEVRWGVGWVFCTRPCPPLERNAQAFRGRIKAIRIDQDPRTGNVVGRTLRASAVEAGNGGRTRDIHLGKDSYLRLQPPSGASDFSYRCDVQCDANGCRGGHTQARPGCSEDRKRRARLHGVAHLIPGDGCGGWNRTTTLSGRPDPKPASTRRFLALIESLELSV